MSNKALAVTINTPADPTKGLLPDPHVARRYQVTTRTIDRWDTRPDLGFPKVIRIGNRKYRRLAELEVWEREHAS